MFLFFESYYDNFVFAFLNVVFPVYFVLFYFESCDWHFHIFDLLLPRLLADAPITAEDIARLGEGGLCLGCAECHWPNCGFGHC